jgi:hypothetical protein
MLVLFINFKTYGVIMLPPKIKLIRMYVVIATTVGVINVANASLNNCYDASNNFLLSCTATSQSSIHNSIYAALKWTFGESFKPEAVLGFRHAKVDSSGDTDGADVSISAMFVNGLELGKLRAKYFNGKDNVQGEVGGGLDFNKGLYTGIGVHAPYSNLGIDLLPFTKDKLEPYLQVDTIKGNRKPPFIYPPT